MWWYGEIGLKLGKRQGRNYHRVPGNFTSSKNDEKIIFKKRDVEILLMERKEKEFWLIKKN